jgi:tRNA A-37 threonylcarbamoyl transferase component Bud32
MQVFSDERCKQFPHYDLLSKNGYKIVGLCGDGIDSDITESEINYHIYIVVDDNNIKYVAREHEPDNELRVGDNRWKMIKTIYKEMDMLGIGPKIFKFIDSDRFCVMEFGSKTYEFCLDDEKLTEKVKNLVDKLHKNGYIHGCMQASEIIIRDDGRPFLIDFATMKRLGDDRDQLSNIFSEYETTNIEICKRREKKRISLV